MQSTERLIVVGIGMIILMIVVYLAWPYIVGFLAVVGAIQVYRIWRQHGGSL